MPFSEKTTVIMQNKPFLESEKEGGAWPLYTLYAVLICLLFNNWNYFSPKALVLIFLGLTLIPLSLDTLNAKVLRRPDIFILKMSLFGVFFSPVSNFILFCLCFFYVHGITWITVTVATILFFYVFIIGIVEGICADPKDVFCTMGREGKILKQTGRNSIEIRYFFNRSYWDVKGKVLKSYRKAVRIFLLAAFFLFVPFAMKTTFTNIGAQDPYKYIVFYTVMGTFCIFTAPLVANTIAWMKLVRILRSGVVVDKFCM